MSNIDNLYIQNLARLNFEIENVGISTIYLVSRLTKYIENEAISPYIITALDKAKRIGADAVYFRYFDNNRAPLAQIYIYDNTKAFYSTFDIATLHKKVWSSGDVPLHIVVDKAQIRMFDSRKPIIFKNENIYSEPIECIDIFAVDSILEHYKAELFDNGSFWEKETVKNNFLNKQVASERLIMGLLQVREAMSKLEILSATLIDRVLIASILIKYLEENGFDEGTGKNLAHAFFKEATGYETLVEIIANNKLVCLLEALAIFFNGGVFQITKEWKDNLLNADISPLAEFFEAGYKNNLFGWQEYSFEDIPVELISNFYEVLIPQTSIYKEDLSRPQSGAYYTPSFLVDMLIDECIPLGYNAPHLNEDVKLIDPTCGSGIFLVSAYKRLVERWRLKNASKGKLADTSPQILKQILKQNIFGIDINPNSVNLTIFSLQLALCSMLTPKQIWTELNQFINLQNEGNISCCDFFKLLASKEVSEKFDLVIGNPPFIQRNLNGESYSDYQKLLEENFPVRIDNPQEEFAFLFAEKGMHLLKKETGKLCLILPSGSLLYNVNSVHVRASLMKLYDISQVIDMTFLRRVLFPATVSSLVLFANNTTPSTNDILHIVARRTKTSKEKSYFEFDSYDFHLIPKELAVIDSTVWKCNLIGGERVFDLAKRMKKIKPKLGDLFNPETENSILKLDSIPSKYFPYNIRDFRFSS